MSCFARISFGSFAARSKKRDSQAEARLPQVSVVVFHLQVEDELFRIVSYRGVDGHPLVSGAVVVVVTQESVHGQGPLLREYLTVTEFRLRHSKCLPWGQPGRRPAAPGEGEELLVVGRRVELELFVHQPLEVIDIVAEASP